MTALSPSAQPPASVLVSMTVSPLVPSVTLCVIGMNIAIHMPSSSIVKV